MRHDCQDPVNIVLITAKILTFSNISKIRWTKSEETSGFGGGFDSPESVPPPPVRIRLPSRNFLATPLLMPTLFRSSQTKLFYAFTSVNYIVSAFDCLNVYATNDPVHLLVELFTKVRLER